MKTYIYSTVFNRLARVLHALGKKEMNELTDLGIHESHLSGRYYGFNRSSELIDAILLDIENDMPFLTLDSLEKKVNK